MRTIIKEAWGKHIKNESDLIFIFREIDNHTQKSDFQDKLTKTKSLLSYILYFYSLIKGVPLVYMFENTVRNFGRLCDRYFFEYSKYHHQQLYGTSKNYESHKSQMFNQFNPETG